MRQRQPVRLRTSGAAGRMPRRPRSAPLRSRWPKSAPLFAAEARNPIASLARDD